MAIEVIIEHAAWQDAGLETLAQRACDATLAHLGLDSTAYEVALLGCDDARIAELNSNFRRKFDPTNVLSWPTVEYARPTNAPTDPELGDIAIAYETCAREAAEQGKPFADHVCHLLVHGVLHLLGYDHETEQEAATMESAEVEILAKMGIPNPYVV